MSSFPAWVITGIIAAVLLIVAFGAKSLMVRVITFFFGLILGFVAVMGAISTWWAWLIGAIVLGLFITRVVLQRRSKRHKQEEERRNGGNTNNFFFGGPPV